MAALYRFRLKILYFSKRSIGPLHHKNGANYPRKNPQKFAHKQAAATERAWGNKMIGTINNGQWTTKLGEGLVRETLERLGETVRRPPNHEPLFPRFGN